MQCVDIMFYPQHIAISFHNICLLFQHNNRSRKRLQYNGLGAVTPIFEPHLQPLRGIFKNTYNPHMFKIYNPGHVCS